MRGMKTLTFLDHEALGRPLPQTSAEIFDDLGPSAWLIECVSVIGRTPALSALPIHQSDPPTWLHLTSLTSSRHRLETALPSHRQLEHIEIFDSFWAARLTRPFIQCTNSKSAAMMPRHHVSGFSNGYPRESHESTFEISPHR